MNVLLDSPRTVVCWAAESSVLDRCVTVLSDAGFDDVVACETESAVRQRATEDDVGCLVVHDSAGADAVVEVCRTLQSAESERPVVVLTDDVSLATEATVAGASATLHTPTDEQLRTVVADTVDAYVDRRTDTEEGRILDAMLDGLETPLYAKDTEGRHLKLADLQNDQDPADAIGKTDIELYGDESPAFARRAYEDDMTVIETESPVFNRDESHAEGGNRYWSRTTKVPWYDDDGRLKGLVGVSHDITELKHKEIRLDEVRDRFREFSRHLSHDLQNPLQVASGYLEMAKASGDTEPLERVEEALDRMSEMIADMSSAASHRGGDDESSTTFPLATLVEDVWDHLSTGEAELVVEIPDDYLVHAQKTEVRGVFEGLLEDAIEHDQPASTADGESVQPPATDVTVTVGLTEDGGFYLADDGPGVPELELDAHADPDAITDADSPISGLALVERIVMRNNWSVTVTDGAETGPRVEIRNCLGVHDRSPPTSRESIPLSETVSVGDLQQQGSVEYDEAADEWTVAGDGRDIWRQTNEFKFAYARVDGPVRIQGQITDLDHVAKFTKAGLMIRDSLNEDAAYGFVGTTPVRGTEFLWRAQSGTDGVSQQPPIQPFDVDWYRVERVGDRITASLSTDGDHWERIDERRIELGDPVYVGLAVSSVVRGVVAEATFRNVSVTALDP